MSVKSDELIRDIYEHDLANLFQILDSSYELGRYELSENEEDFVELITFLNSTVEQLRDTEDLEMVSQEVNWLAEYDREFDDEIASYVERIAGLSSEVAEYIENEWSHEGEEMEIRKLLDPIEEYGEVEYNGNASDRVWGDAGLFLISNTVVQNTREHAREDTSIYAEVVEEDDFYRIDVWDDGPGLQGYGENEIFEKGKGQGTGNGLFYADRIMDVFDGEIQLSRENMEREGGFGLEWYLRPAQYATSEPE